ncbi:ROK family protein [Sulfitobacter sp. D35]|uniref:glucokinase n=1 Tax=Sulfitobacter sp. D35 TaxID=3083252 RepID=UPI0029700438|nr:ROK family protein [Sulfitobacter sp. D35]MDW4496949.1 ROK family protein [Sulfitobacter sp. D35]
MSLILADVGGTNVRFATAEAGSSDLRSIERFQNDDHDSFEAALAAYRDAAGVETVESMCFAVAGPVTGKVARLTNRNWTLDEDKLSESNDGARVHLLNDLGALGYALDKLGDDDLQLLLEAEVRPHRQGQRLVVGVGTGFNVSPVLQYEGMVRCLRAESGLSSMPSRVAAPMVDLLGHKPSHMICVEDALSGPGLTRLHADATGRKMDGKDILKAAASGDDEALETLETFARMLGEMVLDLRLQYMPAGGVFLAGSVARGLVDSPVRDVFVERLKGRPTRKSEIPPVPVSVITRDEAALLGCLAYAEDNR